jgi:hypothetical protein
MVLEGSIDDPGAHYEIVMVIGRPSSVRDPRLAF